MHIVHKMHNSLAHYRVGPQRRFAARGPRACPSLRHSHDKSNEPRQEMANPCVSRGCGNDRHQVSPDDANADERRARDSNPQPLAGHHISSVAANHSLTLQSAGRAGTDSAGHVCGSVYSSPVR
jgi:hypothetical protein